MIRIKSPLSFALALALSINAGCAADEFETKDEAGDGGAAGAAGASSGGSQATGGASGASSGGGADSGAGAGGSGGASGSSSGGASGSSTGGTGSGKTPAGSACSADADCATGFCTDGVCCQSDCSGPCESCNQPGNAGSCQPHADGTDPDQDCLDSAKGTGACAGACDGSGACKMPGTETTCGQTTCVSGKQTGSACNGKGECLVAQTSCAPFTCSGSVCATKCDTDAQCANAGSYCKAGACVPKQALGAACTASNQCTSNACVDGSCCASASCGPSFSCSSGTCQCNGVTCAAGDQCVLWYEDGDGDGFGDKTKPMLGCSSKAPVVSGKTFVKNADDCFDANKNAFPGQTQFFPLHRGDNSYDYDCNGTEQKKHPTITNPSCRDCHGYGSSTAACSLTCGTLGLQSMGLSCNLPNNCGGPKDTFAYGVEVGCGGTGNLFTCSTLCSSGTIGLGPTQQNCR